jgi:hypothetical protein
VNGRAASARAEFFVQALALKNSQFQMIEQLKARLATLQNSGSLGD